MADYNENYTPELPDISDSFATDTSLVGQEDAELAPTMPSIDDAAVSDTQAVGQEDALYGEDLPDITESFTTDPACINCDFEADAVEVAIDQVITFTDLSTGSPDEWLWDFGDGDTSTDQNPTHSYDTSGVYTVSLTATRTDALSETTKTETKTGYIEVVIHAEFEATPLDGDPPLTVQFTDLSESTPDTWLWDFGDGGTSTDQNPSHEYTTGGYYSVKLTVTKGAATDVERKVNYISVTGKTAIAMADELALRLEDPDEIRFSQGGKFILLNKAQIETMNLLDQIYLTEIEEVEPDKSLTDGYLAFSSLNSGNGIFKGKEGILRVQVDIGGAGTLIDAIEIEFESVKETENPYFAGSDSIPLYYIYDEKIYVLITTYTDTTITVSYLKLPEDMGSEEDPTLNDTFQNLIITLAESMGWRIDKRLDRYQTALNDAMLEINYLNSIIPFFYLKSLSEMVSGAMIKEKPLTVPVYKEIN